MDSSLGILVLRLTVGGLMLFHGAAKILNPGSVDFIGGKLAAHGVPEVLANAVYVGEVLAPLMVILGVFNRLGALLIVANMLVAIFLVHMDDIFLLTKHGGWAIELQAFYLFGGLAVALMGSGRLALRPD